MGGPVSSQSDQPQIQLPRLIKDPTWSLKPWPVTVTLAGLEVQIPALPAADWLVILMVDGLDLEDILPGLLPMEEAQAVEDALYGGRLPLDILHETVLDVIGTVSGRTWYVALRIIAAAAGSWDALGGELVLKHVDASRLSLAAWIDAVYLILWRSMDQSQLMMFQSKLEAPPEGFEDDEPEQLMTAEQFMGMNFS